MVWFFVAAALIALGGAVIFGPYYYIRATTRHRILMRDSPKIPEGRVALVLGARVFPDGRLSAMLEDRVVTAVELYKRGVVDKLLMSGDNSSRSYDEVTAMRREAMRLGVPGENVVRDFAGLRTFDSLIRARDIFGQRELVIVTQRFHLPRSLYLARSLGIDAVGVVADRRVYQRRSMRRSRVREIPASWAAVIDSFTPGKGPKFAGEPESLNGNQQSFNFPEQGS
jgi:SanA protein